MRPARRQRRRAEPATGALLAATTLLLALLVAALTGTARAADDDERDARTVPRTGDGVVLLAPLEGAVDPVMVEFVDEVIGRAEAGDADAVVFRVDTPGGLSTSMDDIVRRIVRARDVPVYVWVGPSGARAASAGVFIAYASDVAAMAPGTNMGSATPVAGGGEELPEDVRRKVVNDAVAKIREQATEHERDPEFAEEAVREAANIGATEALERNVIEYVADDVRALLRASHGSTVQPKGLRLELGEAQIEEVEPSLRQRILKVIIDPNVVFLLLGLGVLGIAFEITHPGTILPGTLGAVAFLMGLWGLSVLPTTGAGLALLALAVVLIAAEAFVPSGILGAVGAVALVLGGLLLFDPGSGYGVDWWLLVITALLLFAFASIVARKAIAIRRRPPLTGEHVLIGRRGEVRTPLHGRERGRVYVNGELWAARLVRDAPRPLEPGETCRVAAVDEFVLEVRPDDEDESGGSDAPTDQGG